MSPAGEDDVIVDDADVVTQVDHPGVALDADVVTHIAGIDVTINGRWLRQRCAWCGEILVDEDLSVAVMVPEDQETTVPPRAWPSGRQVTRQGPMSVALQ